MTNAARSVLVTLQIRTLTRADVRAAGGEDIAAAVADVRAVLGLLRAGQAEMPAETSLALDMGAADARVYALPAGLGAPYDTVGVKWTAHRTAHAGSPRIVALTVVNDRHTGLPLGIVESASLTATRTAAVSAVALQTVAPVTPKTVALLGAGTQAQAHLAMLATLFPGLAALRVWNRTPAQREAMLTLTLPWPVVCCDDLQDAVEGCDAVIACTAAASPILDAWAVRPGRIILQIGYDEASFAAIDASTAVVVDLWGEFWRASAKSLFRMTRAGKFDAGRVSADLAAAVHGGWRPQSHDAVYFNSFGLNVFDVALATRVLREAAARNLGRMVPLFDLDAEPREER
jgi:ornithine cyclodeaminase